jgi:hypothetical protein
MKTIFSLFAMLASITASAQSTVQITPISATYTSASTIQFKVNWTSQTAMNHRNKVWVFVDFQPVISPTQKGSWQPATITGTVQRTAGTISEQSNRGFYLEGTTTNFSSTVTVQLSNISTAKFNWCAYGSDFPPNAVENGSGGYTLKGSPPFIITTTTGTFPENTNSFSGGTITALTDATGCPGVLCSKNDETAGLLGCCNGTTNCNGICKTKCAAEPSVLCENSSTMIGYDLGAPACAKGCADLGFEFYYYEGFVWNNRRCWCCNE